jgi:hypothetical protein
LASTACAPHLDLGALAARHPELAGIEGHRLADAMPYLLPARGELVYFLCRWPDGAVIPVEMPPDADEGERLDIENVLRAWEGVGLGVRFGPAEPGRGIEMRYTEDEFPEEWGERSATAVADCALDPAALEAPAGDVLPASLAFVSIHLSRTGRDRVGRRVPWSREERIGALLHEMGHALGFQGHAQRGSIMAASVDEARRAGRGLMAGGAFEDATLRALYAVPSGSVLGRTRVGVERTVSVDRMGPLARSRGLAGPYAQVGDRVARILWRDAHGVAFAVRLWDPRQALRHPASLALFPEPRAADLLREER